MTAPTCLGRRRSPGRSSATSWPGGATSTARPICGSSTPCSPAWPDWIPTTASSPAGGRRSSRSSPAEDRCHLNGMGMRDGRPALCHRDGPHRRGDRLAPGQEPHRLRAGRRQRRADHQRSLHAPLAPLARRVGCSSSTPGWGTLESVDPRSGERVVVERLPGFTRGLACHGDLAFVGLSRIRETAVFGGLQIADRHAELKCGVAVVDLRARNDGRDARVRIRDRGDLRRPSRPGAPGVALGGGERGDGRPGGEIWVVPPEIAGASTPAPCPASASRCRSRRTRRPGTRRPADGRAPRRGRPAADGAAGAASAQRRSPTISVTLCRRPVTSRRRSRPTAPRPPPTRTSRLPARTPVTCSSRSAKPTRGSRSSSRPRGSPRWTSTGC